MIDPTKRWPFGLKTGNWPLFAVLLLAVLVRLLEFDHRLSDLARAQPEPVIHFFAQVTRWGEADWLLYPSLALLVISGLLAWLVPQRVAKLALIEMIEIYALIFVGVGLPGLVCDIVKQCIGRARPAMFDAVGLFGFHPFSYSYFYESFPSGHSTTALSAAMVLGFLAPRWFWVGLLYAAAILASRLILGAHYPTDVLSGSVLGALGAYAVRNFFAARRWGFKQLPDGRIVARPPVAVRRLARPYGRKAAR